LAKRSGSVICHWAQFKRDGMSISAACPGCGTRYRVDDKFAGKRVKCKKCPSAIQFPTVENAAADEEEVNIRLRDDESDPVPAPRLKSPSPAAKPFQPAPPKPVDVLEEDNSVQELMALGRQADFDDSEPAAPTLKNSPPLASPSSMPFTPPPSSPPPPN